MLIGPQTASSGSDRMDAPGAAYVPSHHSREITWRFWKEWDVLHSPHILCCCIYFRAIRTPELSPKVLTRTLTLEKKNRYSRFLKKIKPYAGVLWSAWPFEHLLLALYCSLRLTVSRKDVVKIHRHIYGLFTLIFWLLAVLPCCYGEKLCCGYLRAWTTHFKHNLCFNSLK